MKIALLGAATLCALVGLCACGRTTEDPNPVASNVGGGASIGGDAGAGGGAGAGTGPSELCPVEERAEAPTLSQDCEITLRDVDAAFACESETCPITEALDLTCQSRPLNPSIAAVADGALVAVRAHSGNESSVRLMAVQATASRVEEVAPFPCGDLALDIDPAGASWVFGGCVPGITAMRETGAGWMVSQVVSDGDAELASSSMVDTNLGYLTYVEAGRPHLVTWDGSCWTDESLGGTGAESLVVEVDSEARPWVAWMGSTDFPISSVIFLRSPDGDTHDLPAAPWELIGHARLRLLPRGLDGSAAFPILAERFSGGIRILTQDPATDAGWSERVLGASTAAPLGDCPPIEMFGPQPCAGLASCTEQSRGSGTAFDLVRVESGAVFVAWVEYASEGTYSLEEDVVGGEMMISRCWRTETAGAGKADLVIARLTESEPILTRFHFDLGGARLSQDNDIAVAARGDTLLIAADLAADNVPTLTYLEIDSNLLP